MATAEAIGGFLFVLMLGCFTSLAQVDQNQYGMIFNWITNSIGTEVYHGGLHMIGFWNTLIRFPATVQTIEFSDREGKTAESLHTRTKEGLGLHLGISFQYKLHPEGIPELYALTNIDYEALFVRIARDQVLEAASQYEGPQYWQERKGIGDHMRRLVGHELNKSYASVWDLQLLKIDLPDAYEDSITETQVQTQLVKTKTYEQDAAKVRADTEVIQANFKRNISIVQAGADANFTLVTKLAEAEASKRKIEAEAAALTYVRENLKLSPVGTVEYQQLGAYSGLTNATFLANVVSATPVVSAASVGQSPSLLQVNETPTLAKDVDKHRERGASRHKATFLSPGRPASGQMLFQTSTQLQRCELA